MENSKNIMVSVSCLVYNHEPFLRECFDGFVMQQTTFPIEILVHDDASTDHSADIIREYTEKYPDLFKPIYQKENQYSKGVKITMTYQIPRAKGKYIALCEGDDYWTDPQKLQRQVEFMENNPDFAICFHNAKIWKQKEGVMVDDFITRDVPSETDIYELAKGNYIHTPTVVYRRNDNFDGFISNLGNVVVGDYPMWMGLARYGKIKKFEECMGVYRLGCGIWSGKSDSVYRMISWLNMLCRLYSVMDDKKVKSILEDQIEKSRVSLYELYERLKVNYDSISNSHAYRLGCVLLKPIYVIKKLFKKDCSK